MREQMLSWTEPGAGLMFTNMRTLALAPRDSWGWGLGVRVRVHKHEDLDFSNITLICTVTLAAPIGTYVGPRRRAAGKSG